MLVNASSSDQALEVVQPGNATLELVVAQCEGQSVFTGNSNYSQFREGEVNQLHSPATLGEYLSSYRFSAGPGYFFLKSHSAQKGLFRVFLREAREYPPIQAANHTLLLKKVANAMSVEFALSSCAGCLHEVVLSASNASLRRYVACRVKDNLTRIFVLRPRERNLQEGSQAVLIPDELIPDNFAVTVLVDSPADGSQLVYSTRYVSDYD